MMYEALYRKYRPKTFDDVVGQEFITETLKNQVRTGRLSHAYLFIGTRGTGKTTCARILAKAVNCERPVDGNPCNVCPSCRGIDDGSILDVVELDAASNNGVDDVRMLRDEAVFSPTTVRKRVYIIDEVHMLSKPAFNALLKILEEPPQHLMFILATTELNKVLPTILSRCQRHSFRRLDSDTIAGRLSHVAQQEGIRLEDEAAQLLGRLADGGMRDGLSLLDQCASVETVDTAAVLNAMGLAGSYRTRALAECISDRNVSGALDQYEALWQDGKEPSGLLSELSGFYRDVLLLRLAPKGGRNLVSGAYSESDMLSVSASDSEILRVLNVLQKYQAAMVTAASPRLQGELCMIELCEAVTPAVHQPAAEPIRPAEKPVRTEPETKAAPMLTPPAPEPEDISVPEEPPETTLAEPVAQEPVAPATADIGSGDADFWRQLLPELASQVMKGAYIVLSDPALVTGELVDSELLLWVVPGFETDMVTMPDIINKIRQSASRLAGRPIRVRVEEKTEKSTLNTDKLDVLGQFANVTFR